CSAGRSIEILDERRDHDNLSTDDFEGSNTYDLRFDRTETVTKYVLAVLPDADGWGDDNEEMYHSVGFQVTEDNGYVSQWTNWEDNTIVTFHLCPCELLGPAGGGVAADRPSPRGPAAPRSLADHGWPT